MVLIPTFILLLSIFLFITTCEHDDGLLKVSYHNERKELCIALAFFLLKYLIFKETNDVN